MVVALSALPLSPHACDAGRADVCRAQHGAHAPQTTFRSLQSRNTAHIGSPLSRAGFGLGRPLPHPHRRWSPDPLLRSMVHLVARCPMAHAPCGTYLWHQCCHCKKCRDAVSACSCDSIAWHDSESHGEWPACSWEGARDAVVETYHSSPDCHFRSLFKPGSSLAHCSHSRSLIVCHRREADERAAHGCPRLRIPA